MMRSIMLLMTCAVLAPSPAQDGVRMERYRGGFDLVDGVYTGFEEFKENAPKYPLAVLKDDQGQHVRSIRSSGRLYVLDEQGASQKLNMAKAWGFCDADVVFINAGNGFYRIGQMGALSHLMYEVNYQDWDPYWGYTSITRSALVQSVLDMETGQLLPMNVSTMEAVLAREPDLLEAFMALGKKRKREGNLFFFLHKYNERRPLLFPVRP